jgi:maleate isomerase
MKRIGVLYPSSGLSEGELQRMLPEGVSLHITRVPMDAPTYEAELHMVDRIEEASRLLVDARADIIAFDCTVGSLIGGKGHDQVIINRIEEATGTIATTAATAVVAALRAIGIRRFTLLTPYAKVLHEKEKTFLDSEGFRVLKDRTLQLADCLEQYEMDPSHWCELVKGLDVRESEGCLISCGGIRVVTMIEQLEEDIGKPVLTTNQALIWQCLRKIGVEDSVRGYGRLLTLPLKVQ